MSILDSIQGMLTPQLLTSLAAQTGVPDTKIKNGLSTSTSAIMQGLAAKADDPRAMRDVAQLANQGGDLPEPTSSSFLDADSPIRRAGSQLMGFAGDSPGLIQRITSSLGVGSGAAGTIVGIASGLVMTALRKFGRARGGFDGDSLSSLLRTERDTGAIPSGAREGAHAVESAAYREHHAKHPGRRNLWWLLALIPIVLLAWWLFDRERREERTSRAPAAPTRPDVESGRQPGATPPLPDRERELTPPPAPTTRPDVTPPKSSAITPETDLRLAQDEPPGTPSNAQGDQTPTPPSQPSTPPTTGGQQQTPSQPSTPPTTGQQQSPSQPSTPPSQSMPPSSESEQESEPSQAMPPASESEQEQSRDLPPDSAEGKLLSQAHGSRGAEGTTWIDLDEVEFAVNSAEVPDSAKEQIENVAIVLRENPDVTIEIRGHASSTGSPERNKVLSKQRAENVRRALVDQGIEASRIQVTSSDEQAVPSQGEEQANRRVSARISSSGQTEDGGQPDEG